ncbi:MAG: N-acetylglucosamine kinase [Flavobacteriaceae bacterium]|nr:N-acetylglucosamine kinase [Flavobacteriaceae bacterium]
MAILIADSGSTKTDWILVNKQNNTTKISDIGINPTLLSSDVLYNNIIKVRNGLKSSEDVETVFFYGAGCGSSESKTKIEKELKKAYSNSEIIVKEDIYAAVNSTCNNEKAVVCILGTGSNSCYFDGKDVDKGVYSLGYIIMDEASGNWFGKQLLKDYFYKTMPKELSVSFGETYDLDINKVKKEIYQTERPNQYLAKFSKFIYTNIDHSYSKELLERGFDEFIKLRILPFNITKETPVHFVGSISYYFKEVLKSRLEYHNLSIGNIVKSPIDSLVEYHITKK